mgnify:CR=1 FL=1
MRLHVGDIIHGRYHVDQILGEGGMGYVVTAMDAELRRRVAIKSLHPHMAAHPQIYRRFASEARALASIADPHVVQIYDTSSWQGLPLVIMEYVDGTPLGKLLSRTPNLPLAQVCDILEGTLRGLHAAHARGIIHRDVKPDNLMIAAGPGGRPHVKLLDFGIARIEYDPRMTYAVGMLGTLRYMSPEQIRNPAHVDLKTDLFNVGLIAWELLAGRPLWEQLPHGDDFQFRRALLEEELPTLPPSVPAGLARWVAHLTEKDRERRPANAEAALQNLLALRASREPTVLQPPPGPPEPWEDPQPDPDMAAPSPRASIPPLLVLAALALPFVSAGSRAERRAGDSLTWTGYQAMRDSSQIAWEALSDPNISDNFTWAALAITFLALLLTAAAGLALPFIGRLRTRKAIAGLGAAGVAASLLTWLSVSQAASLVGQLYPADDPFSGTMQVGYWITLLAFGALWALHAGRRPGRRRRRR